MIQNSGRLIVFEGWDGSGKTTLAKLCCDLLNSQGKEAHYLAFPGQMRGTLGLHIHKLHHDPTYAAIDVIHPASLQILHIAAHVDSIESTILPALQRGEWIVLDRYWWSTRAYGIASGVNPKALDMMIDLELLFWKSVRPKAVFLVSRPTASCASTDAFEMQVSAEYERLAERESKNLPVHRISNARAAQDVADEIVKIALA